MSNQRTWECPICHRKIDRAHIKLIEEHKGEHPLNQRAFTGGKSDDTKV